MTNILMFFNLIGLLLVQMRAYTDQKNSERGHILYSVILSILLGCSSNWQQATSVILNI